MSNKILEDILENDFSKREYKILIYVFRNGYGYNRDQSECELNIKRISQFIGMPRQHIWETLHGLEQRNVLTLDNKTILFNRHANSWIVTKTVTRKSSPKQLQNVTKTVTSRHQNSDGEACNPQIVSDIQPPKESLKKKETPIPPESGNCIPLIASEQEAKQIIAFLNEVTDNAFKPHNTGTQRFIKARLSEGFTVEDFRKVIKVKSEQWKGNLEMERYLRPQTLFSNKFEGYLQESNMATIAQSAYGFGERNTGIRGYGL